MKRYRAYHNFLLIERRNHVEFRKQFYEGLFSVNKKNFVKKLNGVAKHYNKFYDMLKIKDKNGNGIIEVSILYYNNMVGRLTISLPDDPKGEFAVIEDNSNDRKFFKFKKGDTVKIHELLQNIESVCCLNYYKIYKNPINDTRYRDYDMVMVF